MKTILIIDDEFTIAEMLSELFEEEGFHVLRASSGREGLSCLQNNAVDLILCDVMMPIMDGLTLCRSLQANPIYKHIPIVLMSAAGGKHIPSDCLYAAFLPKPFDINTALDVVMGVLDR